MLPERAPIGKDERGRDVFGYCRSNGQAILGFDANHEPIYEFHPKEGWPVCGAHPDDPEGPCLSRDRRTGGRCPNHGGESPGAPIQSGSRSKLLRKLGLGDKLDAIRNDAELYSHDQNIELLELAIQLDLDQGIPTGGEWREVHETYKKISAGGPEGVSAMIKLGELLEAGCEKATRLERALDKADRQRRHKEAAAKRESDIAANVSARDLKRILTGVVLAIEEEEELTLVIRRRLQARIARFVYR